MLPLFKNPINSTPYVATTLLVLSLISILFFNFYERFESTGPELLKNTTFDNLMSGWRHSQSGISTSIPEKKVRLHSNDSNVPIHITQVITDLQPHRQYKFTFYTKTRDVEYGKNPWMTARVVLISYSQSDPSLRSSTHVVANLLGDNEWANNLAIFTTEPDMENLRISAQLATGTFWIKEMSLRMVEEIKDYQIYRKLIAALWICASLWIAASMIRLARRNNHEFAVIIFALIILFATLMPATVKENINNYFLHLPDNAETLIKLNTDTAVFKIKPYLPTSDIFKIGHFFMFFILAITALLQKSYPVLRTTILVNLLLFALVTEIFQLFVAGRNAQLGDLLIDIAGIAAGTTLFYIIRHRLSSDSR